MWFLTDHAVKVLGAKVCACGGALVAWKTLTWFYCLPFSEEWYICTYKTEFTTKGTFGKRVKAKVYLWKETLSSLPARERYCEVSTADTEVDWLETTFNCRRIYVRQQEDFGGASPPLLLVLR